MEYVVPKYIFDHPEWFRFVAGKGYVLESGAPEEAKEAYEEYKATVKSAEEFERSNAEAFGEIVDRKLSHKKR